MTREAIRTIIPIIMTIGNSFAVSGGLMIFTSTSAVCCGPGESRVGCYAMTSGTSISSGVRPEW